MLQIGHRFSYDFDLFTQNPITNDLLKKIKTVFNGKATIELVTEDIVLSKTPQNIDLHFVYHPFKDLKKPLNITSINICHLDDLVANKAYTLGRRPVWRDYVDIFFLIKWNYYDLQKIVSLAETKFSNEFNNKLFLEQLVYFNDISMVEPVFLKEKYSSFQIKSFLENQVREYVRSVLG